jgi:hypothetical protein
MPKLKVFRTSIGFHDAYVAAPSQKAALKAWGSDADLFARGVAELVTDPDLAEEPLAKPGEVIKRLRGTVAEQIAALPPEPRRRSQGSDDEEPASRTTTRRKEAPKPRPKPPPDRTSLDEAERAVQEAEQRHASELRAIEEEEAALARKRRKLEKSHEEEIARLRRERDRSRPSHGRAVRRWQG